MPDGFPTISQGTRFEDTSATEWMNLINEVRAFKHMTVDGSLTMTKRSNTIRITSPKETVNRIFSTLEIDEFQVNFVEPGGDAIRCQRMGSGEFVDVAMPWILRRTPFDNNSRLGISYSYQDDTKRIATRNTGTQTNTQTEVRIPHYTRPDIIFAVRTQKPIKNIHAPETDFENGPIVLRDNIRWIDINDTGRMWGNLRAT